MYREWEDRSGDLNQAQLRTQSVRVLGGQRVDGDG